VGGRSEHPGPEVPGGLAGLALDVVATTEVAQHLEEGVMAGGVARGLEIVVLAAGPNAFLGTGRPVLGAPVEADEDVRELLDPRVGEQQGRVVGRNDRTRGNDRVFLRFEEAEEAFTDFGRSHRMPCAKDVDLLEEIGFYRNTGKKKAPGGGRLRREETR